jgi:DNA-binding response OmpR family regulator
VWESGWQPTAALAVHVDALRRKFGDPTWIETVHGIGLGLGRTP